MRGKGRRKHKTPKKKRVRFWEDVLDLSFLIGEFFALFGRAIMKIFD